MATLQWGSFADAGFKELVASADPTLNISERPVSERYTLGDEIGCGSYGRAVRATRIEDGLSVVVKQIRLFEMDEKARMDTLNEAKVLAQFNHVNIVHYYECMLEGGVLNIVMEYAPGGDLAAAIQRRQQEKKPFTEDEIMFWFVQVVLALYHVHGKNVLHRDLKSQNIFIGEGGLLKLGDFGIARVLNSDTELARTVIGSPYYLSPEICEDRPYNRKSDVWSLGCVLYELTTLRRAFDGQSLPALVVKILRGKYPPVPTRYSTPLRALIESMLKQDPKDRPSADAILRKDFVRQHLERYAAHVMSRGLGASDAAAAAEGGPGPGALQGPGSVPLAAAAAALGLAALGAAEARPRPFPAPHRTPRPAAANRPPRGPSAGSGAAGPAPPAAAAAAAAAAAGGGGGDMERCSSYDVSETETAPTTPGEGSSPSKAVQAARRGQQRLVESGWIRQQQAALAQLEGALAAQRVRTGARARVRGEAAAAAAAAAGGGVAGAALEATAKLAELKLQRDAELEAQRRANAAMREQKKAAAARRNHEAAVAMRNRAAERQKEIERNLVEQRAEMEAKAQKALQLAAVIKAKEEARRREQEVAAQQMSAHREHVRAARARINKEQLAELGAQFASRMATALGGGGAFGGGDAASGGPQVLVVDFSAAHQLQQGDCKASPPVRRGSGAYSADGDGAAGAGGHLQPRRKISGQSPMPRASRSSAGAACGDHSDGGAGPLGRGRPAAEPPWKLRPKGAKSGEFPDVQIFTPFGTTDTAASPPAALAAQQPDAAAAEEDQQVGWAAAGVLEVLAQIHTVLEEDHEQDHEQDDGGDGGGDDDGGGGAGAGGQKPPPRGGAAAAAANALKVEELRIELERQLGGQAFLAAYRCLREMQDRADDGDGDGVSSGGGPGGGGGGGPSTQSDLERILGRKLHLARLVHKLITLEDSVFS
ncbi:NimA-related protein kinase 3 [Volvox carteri f. nagariensis]|uniref:non-specific serine/threonine protein kinase n=1 Tax=Volvox carteri f. nagariensis TaxID=3068 RepID=D8TGS1_VOLCA|nr:NimA-related protein kinase 3 [Volvox carteri f. nagariensis]EFJ53307.1 NimA-related protein kinase 3 [Volvox carteri f. nagariensis]|eukprot:XP_002946312.1 NimA-related protein kinase 3 [Volvox carteri f. nagariensis]